MTVMELQEIGSLVWPLEAAELSYTRRKFSVSRHKMEFDEKNSFFTILLRFAQQIFNKNYCEKSVNSTLTKDILLKAEKEESHRMPVNVTTRSYMTISWKTIS